LDRAATADYIAYQRTSNPAEEAESLLVISRSFADRSLWRPALDAMRVSLELREVADVRQQYERMREDHGFRLLDYTVDSDSATPRACFQFSESLPGRRVEPQTLSLDLGSAAQANVKIDFGAGKLSIGAASPGKIVISGAPRASTVA
jgi:hypothetical protein